MKPATIVMPIIIHGLEMVALPAAPQWQTREPAAASEAMASGKTRNGRIETAVGFRDLPTARWAPTAITPRPAEHAAPTRSSPHDRAESVRSQATQPRPRSIVRHKKRSGPSASTLVNSFPRGRRGPPQSRLCISGPVGS